MKAAILYDRAAVEGDMPDQRDALLQAGTIREALGDLGYHTLEMGVNLDLGSLVDEIKAQAPAFAVNLVESLEGRGSLIHLVPALLDALGLPYTGSGTEAIFSTSNKPMAKEILAGSAIPTPEWFRPDGLSRPFPLEGVFIIKSVWEHASVGLGDHSVVAVRSSSELIEAMEKQRQALGSRCFAERYVEGREFNLSILAGPEGPEVLPPAEIRFEGYPPEKRRVVDYRAKWDEESFEYRHTVRSFQFPEQDDPLIRELRERAAECWRLFGLRGYARVDFRVDQDQRPWVLEINANPCLSPDAGFAAAAERAGLGFPEILGRILDDMRT